MEENGYNANSFSKKVDIDPGNLRKKLKGEYGITYWATALLNSLIFNSINIKTDTLKM